jgi:hypothetical protein
VAVNELNKIIKKHDMKISPSKTKAMGFCGKNIKRAKLEIEGKIIEKVPNFNYVGYLVLNDDNDISIKLQIYNKMNGITKGHFGKHKTTETKLRIYNIAFEAALCYGNENWTMDKRNAQKLEAAEVRFMRQLLALMRFDCQRNLTFVT